MIVDLAWNAMTNFPIKPVEFDGFRSWIIDFPPKFLKVYFQLFPRDQKGHYLEY
jgi:hypothetical protein